MSEPIGLVEWLGTIPIMDGALKAHGENGFRITIDLSDDELPAYMRLHLMRGKVIRFTAEATDEVATPRRRRIEQNRTNGRKSTETQAKRRTAKRPTDVAGG